MEPGVTLTHIPGSPASPSECVIQYQSTRILLEQLKLAAMLSLWEQDHIDIWDQFDSLTKPEHEAVKSLMGNPEDNEWSYTGRILYPDTVCCYAIPRAFPVSPGLTTYSIRSRRIKIIVKSNVPRTRPWERPGTLHAPQPHSMREPAGILSSPRRQLREFMESGPVVVRQIQRPDNLNPRYPRGIIVKSKIQRRSPRMSLPRMWTRRVDHRVRDLRL